MEVTISATVSDVTVDVLTAMRQKVADEAGVALALVLATVTPASVLVAFTVNLRTEAAADAALSALSTVLSDPAAASTFLTTADHAVTVETVSKPPFKLALATPSHHAPPPPMFPPLSVSSAVEFEAVVIGAVGGAVSVWLLILCVWRRCSAIQKGGTEVRTKSHTKCTEPLYHTPAMH